MNVDGTGLTKLYNFHDNDGDFPQADLILSGDTLYGTTYSGGNGFGVVFKITTNGTGFVVLHSFNNDDGAFPFSGLVMSGSALYGTTYSSGSGGCGTIFKINTDGTGFTNIYSFTRGNDGAFPQANLMLSGGTLYGTASYGGDNDNGTVFKINTDGTGFASLYSFTGGSDGANPLSSLVLFNGALYGTTSAGGDNASGTIFQINPDGTNFTNLYSFNGTSDGNTSSAGLVLSGSELFGTLSSGGNNNDGGIFAFNLSVSLPAVLNIRALPAAVVLNWSDNSFFLQAAPTASGAFTNVIGATSPYTNAVTDSQKFFRLQKP